jgi:hypothetical protein
LSLEAFMGLRPGVGNENHGAGAVGWVVAFAVVRVEA